MGDARFSKNAVSGRVKPCSNKNGIGKPAQIWCYNTFEKYCFLPVNLLVCRCSVIVSSFDGESVLIVVPLSE